MHRTRSYLIHPNATARPAGGWGVVPLAVLMLLFTACGPAAVMHPLPDAEPLLVAPPSATPAPPAGPPRPERAVAILRIAGRIAFAGRSGAVPSPLEAVATSLRYGIPPEVESEIAPDAPLDVVLSAPPRGLSTPALVRVLSVGLRHAGVSGHGPNCAVFDLPADAAERAGTPARLVCAYVAGELERNGAFMAHTLSAEPLPARVDAALSVYGDAIRHSFAVQLLAARALGAEVVASQARSMLPLFRRELSPLVPELVTEGLELVEDFDRIDANLTSDAAALDVRVRIKLRSHHSFASQTLKAIAASPRDVPDLFARLPEDSHTAWYFANPSPSALEGLRDGLARSFASAGMDPELVRLAESVPVPAHALAYASGLSATRFPGHADTSSAGDTAAWIRAEVVARFGWHILGVDEPMDRIGPFVERGVDAYNHGPIRSWAYSGLQALCAGLPPITKHALVANGLPKGSVEYEMSVPSTFFEECGQPGPPRAPHGVSVAPVRAVLVVVPDGKRTWVGLSLEPHELYLRLRGALTATPAGPSAGPGASIAQLDADAPVDGTPFAAGAVTPAGLALWASNFESARAGTYVDGERVERARAGLDDGLVPLPFALYAATPELPELHLRVRLPRGAW